MATSTPNYGLKKFENGDPPDLPSLAASMDKIDTELKKNETNIGLFDYKGSVAAGADFNNLPSGLWLYGGGAAINGPGHFGLVYVDDRAFYKLQILISSNSILWRLNADSGWPTWGRIDTI